MSVKPQIMVHKLSLEDVMKILGNVSVEEVYEILKINDTVNEITFNMTSYFSEKVSKNNSSWHRCGSLADSAAEYAKNYHFYVALFVCLFGFVSNILNAVVLTRKEMIGLAINKILAALAINDIILMVEYTCFQGYYHFDSTGTREFTHFGAVFAMFNNHISQVLHNISICLTLTLAIWRYLALKYPEKNHILGSKRRCTIAITLSFIIPIVLCAPTFFSFQIESKEIEENNTTYILHYTMMADYLMKNDFLLSVNFWTYAVIFKLLPCFILSVISVSLIRILNAAKRRKQVLRNYESYPLQADDGEKSTKAERRADRTTRMLIAVLFLFLLTEFPQGLFSMFIALKGRYYFLVCYQKYGAIMDIFALFNGSVTFIIYCCMNRMFRVTFGQLFKQRLLTKFKTETGNSDMLSTYV